MKKLFKKVIFKNFIICLWILTQKLIKMRKHSEEVVNKKLKQIYTNKYYRMYSMYISEQKINVRLFHYCNPYGYCRVLPHIYK